MKKFALLFIALLVPVAAWAGFTVNQTVSGTPGGASVTYSISVPAGHTVVCYGFADVSSVAGAGTVTDSAGNTYTVGTSANYYGVRVVGMFYSLAIPTAITSVTFTPAGTPGLSVLIIWDISATGTIAVGTTAAVGYPGNAPGTTNGVTTGSLSVTGSSGLILAGLDDQSSAGSAVGTGFTSDYANYNTSIIGEHQAVTTSTAATFTAGAANDQIGLAGLSLYISGGSTATTTGASILGMFP